MTPSQTVSGNPQRVEIDGAAVVYRSLGSGPPVVLVHGLAGSGRWWDRNLDALAAGYRVFVVDLPGFGANRPQARFVLAGAPALLSAWAERIGIGRAAWIGHSMGGRIVAELAADDPERVARLVLVAAAIFPAAGGWSLRVRHLPGAVRNAPLTLLPVVASDLVRAEPRTLLRASRSLLATGVEAKLPDILARTLVVWGEHDALVPSPFGQRAASLIPAARLVVLPGADHTPMWGRAAAFNADVLGFLDEGRARGNRWC